MSTENTDNSNEKKFVIFTHDLQRNLVAAGLWVDHIRVLQKQNKLSDKEFEEMLDKIDENIKAASTMTDIYMHEIAGIMRKKES